MYALINKANNVILSVGSDFFDLADTKPFYWRECPAECTTAWVFDGQAFVQPEIEEPSPSNPEFVPLLTPRQIRFVLNSYNLRQAVESAVSAADQTTKDWWEFSLDYQYDHPVLQAMASQLGLSQDQVKQMFIEGAQL